MDRLRLALGSGCADQPRSTFRASISCRMDHLSPPSPRPALVCGQCCGRHRIHCGHLAWFIRNYEVFHRIIPFRDNMGMVLRLGTKGTTSHWAPYELGPWHNDAEWNEFK